MPGDDHGATCTYVAIIRAYAHSDPATPVHTVSFMINPEADRPVYKQLADLVREQITQGELAPGQRVPAEKDYVDMYGISRDSVRRAMAVLRSEGLIITTSRGSRVRPEQRRQVLTLGPHDSVTARMPSPEERLQLGVKEGVPILIVDRVGFEPRVLPADRWVIQGAATYPGG